MIIADLINQIAAAGEDNPREFLAKFFNALLRVVAVAVFGAAHYGLEKLLIAITPKNFEPARLWLEDISFVTFVVIFVYLSWDMLKIFLPFLQSKPYPQAPSKADDK